MSAAPGDDPTLRRSLARWQRSGSVIGLALVLAFPIYLGVERTRRDEALVSRQQAMSALGGELWAQNCASCHGIDGEPTDGHAEGEAGGGDAGGDAVPDEPEPPEEVAGPEEVLITITGRGCEPLEMPVPAGERFKLVLANERDDAVSFDAPALDLHPHVEAGQRVEIALRLEAGEDPFECLGSGHGEILGVGQIHAE